VTPAWTVTSMSSTDRRRTASIRDMSTQTPPRRAATCPSSDVPAPNGTSGVRRRAHARTTPAASSTLSGHTTMSGGAGGWKDSSVPC
jgi:hypothetical protein